MSVQCDRCLQQVEEVIGRREGAKWCRRCAYVASTWHGRTWQPSWCADCGLRGDHTDDCPQRCPECHFADKAHPLTCTVGASIRAKGSKGI